MSVVIGMLCKDSIILASDSQTTCDSVKETNIDKIHFMEAKGTGILVAQAGNADRSWRAFEILRNAVREAEITDDRTIANLAQTAMMQVRSELRQQLFNCPSEEVNDYIWKHDQQCWLMIAHYYSGRPLIFAIDLATGLANLKSRACDCCYNTFPNQHYATVGTGGALAAYLLHEFTKTNMPYWEAVSTVLYVVEEVKKHDTYCSGDSKIGILSGNNAHSFPGQEKLAAICEKLKNFNKSYRGQLNRKLVKSVSEVGKQHLAKPKKANKSGTETLAALKNFRENRFQSRN